SRRRHTRFSRDWSSDVCSSDLTFEQQQFEVWREVLAGNLGEQAVGLVVGIFLSRHFANAFDPRFFPHLAENNNNQGNGDDRGERSEERRVGTGWRRGGASEHE